MCIRDRNNTVRKITRAGTNWVVSTIAGYAGMWGSADGASNAARFCRPQGIAVDISNNVYVVDSGNATVRRLTPSGNNWIVSTVAGLAPLSGSTNGTGTAARFNAPGGIALSSSGSVFVSDTGNNTIRLSGITASGAPAIINQ